MHYMMLPLREQYDGGFGMLAEAFLKSGKRLTEQAKPGLFLEHLPVQFLFRHAVELFLKSGIVIIHKRLDLPYTDKPGELDPSILVDGKLKKIWDVHRIAPLFHHWKAVVNAHSKTLKRLSRYDADWAIEPEVDEWVGLIEVTDPSGTFYRYPSTKAKQQDEEKWPFKEMSMEEAFERFVTRGKKVMALGLEDAEGNLVGSYALDDEAGMQADRALQNFGDWLHNYHAMMRFELTGGA